MSFQQAVFHKKGLSSLTDISGQTEFILPSQAFGFPCLQIQKSNGTVSQIDDTHSVVIRSADRPASYRVLQDDLNIVWSFTPQQKEMSYQITVENTGNTPLTIQNLSLTFPMNTEFNWGEKAGQKVIRHSHIAGHNSYLFFTRCDGQAPYLIFLPQKNTSLEYFDLKHENKNKGNEGKQYELYRAYLHASAQEKVAAEKGCTWRQPVSERKLNPGEKAEYSFVFLWAENYEGIRGELVSHGLIDVKAAPGMVIPAKEKIQLLLTTQKEIHAVSGQNSTRIQFTKTSENQYLAEILFEQLGENLITIDYGQEQRTMLEFFITEPADTLLAKRAAFIADKQIRDDTLWYNGLFCEWNNETHTLLSPDNYDNIKGWRIYEVTCDDPGLSKPAFLASKNAVLPRQDEVTALDNYIKYFVWGGLQCTTEEEYPYGIYGIPDWYKNRNSDDLGERGQEHIWRIYDYPHIALVYFRMYEIAAYHSFVQTQLSKEEYLERAYQTALAMFQIPDEIVQWSALQTGLYNELVIPEIIQALENENQLKKARRLRRWWERKVHYFAVKCDDIFGSEYPFDTTGFESTQALVTYALNNGLTVFQDDKITAEEFHQKAKAFQKIQLEANIACRGYLEPAYYLLGSDIRGNNAFYTLSYMSQMASGAILDAGFDNPAVRDEYFKLGYASLLSSWALLNSGTKDSNYGYWFPGKESDGAAGGGFEPAPYGYTWLEQPHHRGSWYYSCEIDLGYCGYLRNACTIVHKDKELGWMCYGGEITSQEENLSATMKDGVYQRFIYSDEHHAVKINVNYGKIQADSILLKKDFSSLELDLQAFSSQGMRVTISSSESYTITQQNEDFTVLPHKPFQMSCSSGKLVLHLLS